MASLAMPLDVVDQVFGDLAHLLIAESDFGQAGPLLSGGNSEQRQDDQSVLAPLQLGEIDAATVPATTKALHKKQANGEELDSTIALGEADLTGFDRLLEGDGSVLRLDT